MEADLSRFHHTDLRDLWRFDEQGRRRLTLRGIYVRIRNLPPESACVVALGGDGFTSTDYLLMDLFHTQAGSPHPARVPGISTNGPDPEREKKLAAARRRAAEHRQRTEGGVPDG